VNQSVHRQAACVSHMHRDLHEHCHAALLVTLSFS
jgi:hypothetical protein